MEIVTVTDLAAEKIKEKLQKRGQGIGIKIGTKTTGCSGLAYVLEYVDAAPDNHIRIVDKGVELYIDTDSVNYLQNLEIDYEKQGLNEGFAFKNPNEKDRCGCGQSFRV